MDGAYQFNQDNLILQLKNMQKPPISKEMAKELGFDPKKYEGIINKLLSEISEVRKERIKENLIFEEKLKAMQYITSGNDKNTNINRNNLKNKPKKNTNTKNIKLNINRPKSNYKFVKSSGYGMPPKKINIFSSRPRKKTKDNNKTNNNNNIPSQKIPNKKNKNLIHYNTNNNNKSNNSSKIVKNNNYNSNNNNKINNNINNIIENNPNMFDYKDIINEIEKIKNENKIIENRYQNIPNNSLDPLNNIMNNKKQNKPIVTNINEAKNKNKVNNKYINFKNNYDLINKNIENISKGIIDELLYELVFDLQKIENEKAKKDKNIIKEENKQKNLNIKNIKNNFKYKSIISKDFIDKCNKNKNDFLKYMKLKGSFFIKNIFQIYEDFVEEISQLLLEEGLNYCIKQMDDFINQMEKNNNN